MQQSYHEIFLLSLAFSWYNETRQKLDSPKAGMCDMLWQHVKSKKSWHNQYVLRDCLSKNHSLKFA